MRVFFCATAGLILLIVLGCKHDPIADTTPDPPVIDPTDTVPGGTGMGVPCDPDSVYFGNTILPILVANCTQSGCHNSTDHKNGIVLTSYEQIMTTVEGVTLTDWHENKLVRAITETDPDKRMPQLPNPTLTPEQISQIQTWVSQGAQNNTCNANFGGCETAGVTYANFFQPLFQAKCQGCHSSASAQGGVVMAHYAGAKTVALNGKLYAAVTRTSNWMPNGGAKLDDCTREKIKAWIDAGAPEN